MLPKVEADLMSIEDVVQADNDHVDTFLVQEVSMRVRLEYISLFMFSSLLASCFSFKNSSSSELRQFMVSARESTIEREEFPIWVISVFSSFILSICRAISCRSFSRCSCSSFRLWSCLWRSISSCSSFWTFMIRLSIFTRRCESSEQILLTMLLKQVAVLSQIALKNMTASKSSEKSCTLDSGSSRCRILTISSLLAFLISSARLITSSLISMSPFTLRPIFETRREQMLTISPHIASILMLLLFVISSMKSLIASLALSDRMFKMCLLFTKLEDFIVLIIDCYDSLGTNRLFLSYFLGCLNKTILPLSIRYLRNFCSSGSKSDPLQFLSSSIFLISLWQSVIERSLQARLTIMMTPSLISSKVLKDLSRFFVSLGSLSALASLMWDSSIMITILTLGQMSRSLCTKKELEIQYSQPLLSLKPGQSQNARFSITSLFGIDVYEYFSCPILIRWFGQSSTGFNPSQRTVISAPERKAIIVLFPTPVSPITMIAQLQLGSLGMQETPLRIISFSFSRFRGFSI